MDTRSTENSLVTDYTTNKLESVKPIVVKLRIQELQRLLLSFDPNMPINTEIFTNDLKRLMLEVTHNVEDAEELTEAAGGVFNYSECEKIFVIAEALRKLPSITTGEES